MHEHVHPSRRRSALTPVLCALALVAAISLFVLAFPRSHAAADSSPPIDILGETADGIAATIIYTRTAIDFSLQVFSPYSRSVRIVPSALRLMDADGRDFEPPAISVAPDILRPHDVTSITASLNVPQVLEPSTYFVELALAVDGQAVPPTTTKVRIIVPAASLTILNHELVAQFSRSDDVALLNVRLRVEEADARDVTVCLTLVRTGDGGKQPVEVDFAQPWGPQSIPQTEEMVIPIEVTPRELPGPGTYTGRVGVAARNASPTQLDFALIVPSVALQANPAQLDLWRCWPDWNPRGSDAWSRSWQWAFGLLGCGGPPEGITLRTSVSDQVATDVRLHASMLRDSAGMHLVQVEFPEAAATVGNSRQLDLPAIGFLPSEIRVDLRLPGPGMGIYNGDILVDSPDMAEPLRIAVTAKVRHQLVFALAAVALGVMAGSWLLRAREPENSPSLIRTKLLELREWSQGAQVPQPLATRITRLVDTAIGFDLKYGRLAEAKEKLAEAQQLRLRFDSLGQEIVKLQLEINDDHKPGLRSLQLAGERLSAGDLDGANAAIKRARDQHARAAQLLERVASLRKMVDDHAPTGSPCDRDPRIETVKRQVRDVRHAIKGDGVFDSSAELAFSQQVEKSERLYGQHLVDPAYHPAATMKDISLWRDLSRAVQPFDGSIVDVLPEVSTLVERVSDDAWSRPMTDQLLRALSVCTPAVEAQGADLLGVLPRLAASDDFASTSALLRERLFYVTPADGETTYVVRVPNGFEVRERVAKWFDRKLDTQRYAVEWALDGPQGRLEALGSQAMVVFDATGDYVVRATVSPLSPEPPLVRLRCEPWPATVVTPNFEVECLTPSGERRAGGPLRFTLIGRAPSGQPVDVGGGQLQCSWEATALHATPAPGRQRWLLRWRRWLDIQLRRTRRADSCAMITADGCTSTIVFGHQGRYQVTVTVCVAAGPPVRQPSQVSARTIVHIGLSELEQEARQYRRQQRRAFYISLLIAVLGGILAVQAFAETFGSLQQYLIAMLWGAGVNVTATGSISGWGTLINRITALWAAKAS